MTARHLRLAVVAIVLVACTTGPDGSDPAVSVSSSTTTMPDSTAAPPGTDGPPLSASANPPFDVATFDGEIVDATRDRIIRYRVYAPTNVTELVPIIVVSHGGLGNERGHTRGGHLGSAFATGGHLALHIGHRRSPTPRQHRFDRPLDVTFLLDALRDGNLDLPPEFTGVADLARVGHAGHSYGAYTSHALAGARFDDDPSRDFRDARIRAIAPISPQGPGHLGSFDRGPSDNTWRTVTVPVYLLVGGNEVDRAAASVVIAPGWRLVPWTRYPGTSDAVLTVMEGLDHSDMWSTGGPEVERYLATQILRFFDVYVAGRPEVDPCSIGAPDIAGVSTERRPSSGASLLGSC